MSNNIPNLPGNWTTPIVYASPIASRLDELLGDIHLTGGEWEVDLDGMYAAAVAEVADLLPAETLVDYCETMELLGYAGGQQDSIHIRGSKVLYVRRQDNLISNGNGQFYECKEVTFTEFQQAAIPDSIYAATASSPVYTIRPFRASQESASHPILQMLPGSNVSGTQSHVSNAEVYLFEYPTALPGAEITTIVGMPSQLTMAVLLRTATHVLNAYLAWAVHEEEDNEIVALVASQIEAYQSGYQAEMKRYMEGANE